MYIADHIKQSKGQHTLSAVLPWLAFAIYILIATFTMMHHELWGDELHSWNMAKASNSFQDLLHNRRYEGHPPAWHIVLWLVTRFTHDPVYMQWLHLGIAIMVIYLILFRSPLPLMLRLIMPFGYYLLYEYAIISRNYMPGVLVAFLICITLHKSFRGKLVLYYALLLILSQMHVFALILAGCIHLYYLSSLVSLKKNLKVITGHTIIAGMIFLTAIYFIKPPSDSDLSIGSWLSRWTFSQLVIDIQAPLRAFVPMPAWWRPDFWNQAFLLDLNSQYKAMKVISPAMALGFVLLGAYVLKGDRRSMCLYLANIACTFIAGNIYTLTAQRYTGFIFIGFLVSLWLHAYHRPFDAQRKRIIGFLLVVQLIAGGFIVFKDISLPFSNAYRVKELLLKVPEGSALVTDYWALSALSAYTDKPYYCVDLEANASFIIWGSNMVAMRKNTNRYYNGVHNFLQVHKLSALYMVSNSRPGVLYDIDPKLLTQYHVEVVAKYEGAIEKWSNLYLYRIRVR